MSHYSHGSFSDDHGDPKPRNKRRHGGKTRKFDFPQDGPESLMRGRRAEFEDDDFVDYLDDDFDEDFENDELDDDDLDAFDDDIDDEDDR